MLVQEFDGGVLYSGALQPLFCDIASDYIQAIEDVPALFTEPAINKAAGVSNMVRKAWITYPDGTNSDPSLHKDFNKDGSSLESQALDMLMSVCCRVDRITEVSSDKRFIQIYNPGGYLAKHKDTGKPSRIVGLAGIGEFVMYDDNENITQVITICPGDILHFFGKGLHSAFNKSLDNPRVTLGLIDAK